MQLIIIINKQAMKNKIKNDPKQKIWFKERNRGGLGAAFDHLPQLPNSERRSRALHEGRRVRVAGPIRSVPTRGGPTDTDDARYLPRASGNRWSCTGGKKGPPFEHLRTG